MLAAVAAGGLAANGVMSLAGGGGGGGGRYSEDEYASLHYNTETESNWSRRCEEVLGLRVGIYSTNGKAHSRLDGLIVSYDESTGCHGILFDSGIELDIDLSEEQVSSINKERDRGEIKKEVECFFQIINK